MKRGVWITLVGILVLALGLWYVSTRESKQPFQQSSAPVQSERQSSGATTQSTDTRALAGEYLTYSGDLSVGSGRRLLFFHAPWCPQCRALETSIAEQGIPAGTTVIKVDYDSNQKLRQQYGVTIQTTLVEIDSSNGLVERHVAYESPSIGAVSDHFGLE